MWVQEGSDCKDGEDDVSRTSSSLFSRGLYSFVQPKTTVSTSGIAMVPPTPTTSPQKARGKEDDSKCSSLPAADEKEEETDDPDTEVADATSLGHLRPTASRPITPAKFLENMSRRNKEAERDGNVPAFNIEEVEAELVIDKEKKQAISSFFELDCDGVEVEGSDDSAGDQSGGGQTFELSVVGKKICLSEDDEAEDDEDEEPAVGGMEHHITAEEDDRESVDLDSDSEDKEEYRSFSRYVPQRFNGLDVKQWGQWTECMEFSKEDGLVVVEVYSVVFGPSEAMYPFIDEMVLNRERKVRFVRLSLHTMSSMEVVHDAIVDHKHYYPTPEPVFLLIQNGKKVAQIKGTKPRELGSLIDKYMNAQQRAATAPVSPMSVKYKSIFKARPKTKVSSSMFQTPRKPVAVSVEKHGAENIRNLLRKSQSEWTVSPSEHSSPTKLWRSEENDMILID